MPCPICDGTGWKPVEENGHRRVVRCDCWREGLGDRLMAEARIPRRYQHCSFDNFISYPNEKLNRAVKHAQRFAEAFPVVDKGLLLMGPPGIGKSHLAVAVVRHVVRTRGARGLFYDVRDLLRVIRSTYNPASKTPELEVLGPVITAELLVLDDIGAEKPSEWVAETLNLIVNSRYAEKRPTILTTNYEVGESLDDPECLQVRLGLRMYSRLHEMCEFLDFEGGDYRELPPNGGVDELVTLWKRRRPGKRTLPTRSAGPARAQLQDGKADLKWPGGKAGT